MVKETRTTFTWPVCRELFSGSLKHLVNRRNCVAAIDDPVLYQLSGDNNLISAITAILPFVKVHAVNPQHDRNKILALQYAAITVLEDLVNLRNPDRVQHHVCCILNELAFQDSTRCFTPVIFPDLIEELSILLNPAAGQRQEVSVRTQFRSPSNLMAALAAMAMRDLDARHIAIGAIDSLSHCGASYIPSSPSTPSSARSPSSSRTLANRSGTRSRPPLPRGRGGQLYPLRTLHPPPAAWRDPLPPVQRPLFHPPALLAPSEPRPSASSPWACSPASPSTSRPRSPPARRRRQHLSAMR